MLSIIIMKEYGRLFCIAAIEEYTRQGEHTAAHFMQVASQLTGHYGRHPSRMCRPFIARFLRTVTAADAAHMKQIVQPAHVITDDESLRAYNVDWQNKYIGDSRLVVRPRTVDEVSSILRYCHDEGIAVVPQR